MIFALVERLNRESSVTGSNLVLARRSIQGNSGNIGTVSKNYGAKSERVAPEGVFLGSRCRVPKTAPLKNIVTKGEKRDFHD